MSIQNQGINAEGVAKVSLAAFLSACCMLERHYKCDGLGGLSQLFNKIKKNAVKEAWRMDLFDEKEEIICLVKEQIEFYEIFGMWHPGVNQLERFKRLSFKLNVEGQKLLLNF